MNHLASTSLEPLVFAGSNTGIGFESALNFARRGARVILACRSPAKGEEAATQIKELTNNDQVVFRLLDNASQESVRQFAGKILREEPRLDILVHNAGESEIMFAALKAPPRPRSPFTLPSPSYFPLFIFSPLILKRSR